MTRIERRVFRNCTLLGALITLLVLLLDRWGALRTPENWMYDLRARYCQQFNSAPTDRLVHLDIDDNALQTIGWWPWPRAKMAEIIDELHRAGAAAMATEDDLTGSAIKTPVWNKATVKTFPLIWLQMTAYATAKKIF